MFFGYVAGSAPHMFYSVYGPNGQRVVTQGIDLGKPVMTHDMAITENYSVLLDLPLVFDPTNILSGFPSPAQFSWGGDFQLYLRILVRSVARSPKCPPLLAENRFPFGYDPQHPARIGLLPRYGGRVEWFEVDTCNVFHTVNAYEVSHVQRGIGQVISPSVFLGGVRPGSQTPCWRPR